MSKGLNNPKAFSTQDEAESSPIITPAQITDAADFPHTGLIKALSLGMKGNYATTGFNATAVTDNDVTFAAGVVYRDGKKVDVNAGTTQTITIGSTSGTTTDHNVGYHLVVNATGTTNLSVRPPTGANAVPAYTEGDVIIAILAYTTQDPMQIQFLTVEKIENSVSIGYDASGYTESLLISSTSATNTSIAASTTAAGTAGRDLTISAGTAATASSNNTDGGDLILKSGGGDGTGTSVMTFSTKISGTDAVAERMRIHSNGNVGIGTAAPTELLHLSDADGTEPTILIENTGTAANEPEIVFIRSTGTGADSRDIGHIRFKADDTAGNPHNFASFLADSEDADSGTEDGRFIFFVTKGGTDSVEHLRISGSSGIIFNEGGADIDVRIEGDTDTHLFFAEAGEDKIGIGTNNPTAKLHVAGGAIVTGGLTIGAGSNEFTITESSDDITLANTVNDKDIDISVNDGGGTGRRAKFTANTHSNEVILKGIEEVIIVALSDETTNLAAGTAKASFHMPYAMLLSKVKASVNTAPTGSVLTVDINEAGTTILSTKLTIDAGEFTSDTAATAAVISDAALADNALITFDIDGVGSSATGKGLKVTLYGKRT